MNVLLKLIPFVVILTAACGGESINNPAIQDLKQKTVGSIFPTLPAMVEKEWRSQKILPSSRLLFKNNSLASSNQSDRNRVLRKFLDDRGVHPLMKLAENPSERDKGRADLALSSGSDFQVKSYGLRVGNYDVCDANIRTVETAAGTLHAMGVLPQVTSVQTFSDDAWPSLQASTDLAVNQLRTSGVPESSHKVTKSTKCLYAKNNTLSPAWLIIVRMGHLPYRLYVGQGEVFEGNVMAFDVTAKVKAYNTNPADGMLSEFDIAVSGDGYLTNEYFTTSPSSGIPRQQSSSHTFTQPLSSVYFAEQSAFANVNRHFDFASANGYVWSGPKPLTLVTNIIYSGGDINNASYTPYDGETGPFILFARGDGKTFQNLMFDSDVASHEFGHHIVFANVTDLSGESVVIHEGIADSITFMRTGDACLGESVCPLKSDSITSACQINGKCLRSGETDLKYKDATYNSAGMHAKSQVISGMFWDLYRGGKIPVADLKRLTIATTNFLPSKADMRALIVAILDADLALFGQRYQSNILEAASARGLGVETLGISVNTVDGIAPQRSAPNIPYVSALAVTNLNMPTWTWVSGGGGNGTFRYRLDNSDLTMEAITTTATSFKPSSALRDGTHTLYVQERDAAGNWSPSGRRSIDTDSEAPSKFLITGPTALINSQTPNVTWVQAVDFNRVTYFLKVASSSTCDTGVTQTYSISSSATNSTSQQLTALADGNWYICITASDQAGNSTVASNNGYKFSVDVTVPNAPTVSGKAFSQSKTPIWTWTSGGGGNGTYRYRLDSSDLTNAATITTSSSFTPSSGLKDGGHVLYVQERDAAGNWSLSGSRVITIDTAAPAAFSILGSSNSSNNQTPTLTWSTATDATAVTYVLKIATSKNCTTGVTQTFPDPSSVLKSTYQQVTPLAEGTWYACVTASDRVGNSTAASNDGYPISVDLTPPDAPIVLGPSATNSVTPTWTWVSSGGGNGTFRYRLDNSDVAAGATITTSFSYKPTSPLSEGTHVLYVQERDAAGNWSLSGSKAIDIDTVAPKAFSITGPANLINIQNPKVTWGASTDANGVSYTVKVANSKSCTTGVTQIYPSPSAELVVTSQQLANIAEGTWYICVTALDYAGNTTNASNNGYQVSVDLTPPNATVISGLPLSPDSASAVNLEIGGEALASYQYAFLKSANSSCRAGVTYSTWVNAGSRLVANFGISGNTFMTLCLIGKDAAGNIQTLPSIYRWLRHASVPANTLATEFATIEKGVRGAGAQALTFSRKSNISASEKATAQLCKYTPATGAILGCVSRNVTFQANSVTASASFSPISAGSWVGILIPANPARGRALPLELTY